LGLAKNIIVVEQFEKHIGKIQNSNAFKLGFLSGQTVLWPCKVVMPTPHSDRGGVSSEFQQWSRLL
jgi:hypothetical protein